MSVSCANLRPSLSITVDRECIAVEYYHIQKTDGIDIKFAIVITAHIWRVKNFPGGFNSTPEPSTQFRRPILNSQILKDALLAVDHC